MVVLNRMSRYDLVLEALRRSRRVPEGADRLTRACHDQLARHRSHVVEALEEICARLDGASARPTSADDGTRA